MRTILWFLVGAALGGILAALYAPQSGKKTRKRLGKQMKKMQLEFEAQTEKNVDRFKDWRVSTEEMVEEAAKQVNGNGTYVHS